jgi:hypothetical protein
MSPESVLEAIRAGERETEPPPPPDDQPQR